MGPLNTLARSVRRRAVVRSMRVAVVGAGIALATAAAVVLPAGAASADPSVAEIEAQIDKNWNQLEPTIEQYNKIHGQLAANRTKQAELAETIKPLQLQVDLAMSRVSQIAVQTYKTGSPSTASLLLNSDSSGDLLDQLSIINQMSRIKLAEISNVAAARDRYQADKRALDDLVGQLAKQDTELAAKKKDIEAQIANLQKMRQQVYGNGGTGDLRPASCPFEYLGGAGGEAARKACAQIGKPYVYASSGPDSFDCSGLTMYAWAGLVGLPHSALDQYNRITHVSRSELRTGDLVFYYSPIHHVAIYVGGDWIVHAPQTGDYVRMAKINGSATPVGYGRPG